MFSIFLKTSLVDVNFFTRQNIGELNKHFVLTVNEMKKYRFDSRLLKWLLQKKEVDRYLEIDVTRALALNGKSSPLISSKNCF